MNFQPTELTQQVAQSAKDFAQQFIKPYVMEWDETQEFPLQVFKELGKLGMMGVLVPEAYGGTGLSYFEYNAII
ncbi:MAG: acyl-CoA dehydrogenase family protein, partial [Chitinophagaceae bacterium]|nr:acyl-CoA dehydrogenase family protein [Chitinophagaceae bacterium]